VNGQRSAHTTISGSGVATATGGGFASRSAALTDCNILQLVLNDGNSTFLKATVLKDGLKMVIISTAMNLYSRIK
jgi:hypothetical protein